VPYGGRFHAPGRDFRRDASVQQLAVSAARTDDPGSGAVRSHRSAVVGSPAWLRAAALAWLLASAGLLVACGGGGAGATPDPTAPPGSGGPTATVSESEAARLLTQASFGPTDALIAEVARIGPRAWLDAQAAVPRSSHRETLDRTAAELATTGATLNANHFYESWWKQAVTAPDALRQRVTFALSQIFVVSFADSAVNQYPRGVASYVDTLAEHALGNYRDLLEAVSLHPMMGLYLSHLRNQKADATTGRVPDENYAREVMQLFSIGLFELDAWGEARLDGQGRRIESYTEADINGLARVFTGWSWYAGPNAADRTRTRFFGGNANAEREWRPMQSYPEFHATTEKRFLGSVIAPQTTADPQASLRIALDRLFNHPNVGPFIGRQLIQRLVKSNPSADYVGRVAAAFNDNGRGVRGDLMAVVRAVLLDAEARAPAASDATAGKLHEPVLRLAHWMRAFGASSRSGRFQGIDNTDDPATRLAQTPLRSPSVFNFYRPGYVPPNTGLAQRSLVAPEFQIASDVSVAGYLNYLQGWVRLEPGSSRDVRPDYSAELALVDQPTAAAPTALVDRIDRLLLAGRMSAGLKTAVLAGVAGRSIPAANRDASGAVTNQAAIDNARRDRVAIAVFLTMASPEYLTQP
jgi:uncharacterized protein (DUF1800 family)